jgi:hypothetical protein
MRLEWIMLDPRMTLGHLGYIPGFIVTEDSAPAWKQINETYIAGWRPFKGFDLTVESMRLSYPGDPPMFPLAMAELREEKIFFYPSAWVLILQPDGSFEVARLD